ncbi:uncharacterized protein LOC125287663 [Alosa alosa]|uniref:uncharacterized protein LOC125287663 n=1 Tax=Alosa alosa TaxID=278164 RepID=UPI002015160C|nr:uncharacterized protein LOC125287663 [Alosa alosa]
MHFKSFYERWNFISRTRQIGEIVRQCFDDIPDVDICRIDVLSFTQQFPAEELEMIRAAFIVAFTDEELDWAMERLIRCIAFLTLDFVMPALRVCVRMEPCPKPVPAAPRRHPVLQVQPAPGSEGAPDGLQARGDWWPQTAENSERAVDGPQAGGDWWLENTERLLVASTPHPHFLVAKRQGKNRRTRIRVEKCVTAKALEITSVFLAIAPGNAIWDRFLYASSQDYCKSLRTNRHRSPRREAYLDLIEGTADLLIDMRRCQRQSSTDGVVCGFADFRTLIMEHFILESSRCLLERLMNAPSHLQLEYSSRVWPEMEEVPILPQGSGPDRELVMALLTKAISENVAAFLDEAVERINRQRGLSTCEVLGCESYSAPKGFHTPLEI